MTFIHTSEESRRESGESEIESQVRVAALLNRYLVSLDEEELDAAWAAGLFTQDAVVAFPISRHEGLAGMADYHSTALSAFAATMHLGSPAVVEVSGDSATLRANLVSTHVHRTGGREGAPQLFTTGTSVHGRARFTPLGWRLSELSFRLVWADGSPRSEA
ncbi:nuclear transport factor 2 family protein [Streptomyces sp. NPDC059862]|uniref:nuclear transport factor 2 family protein n=1 Tax=unclassified Streptomyces TaxID=2593676 RepID=UPI00363DA0E0